MFDAYRKKPKKDDTENFMQAGIDFNNNEHIELNDEGNAHNVAETRKSSAAQKGFFIICCFFLIILLGFMYFKEKVKSDENADIQSATQASNKTEIPKFELPPDPAPPEALPPLSVEETNPLPLPMENTAPEQPPEPTPHEIRLRSALMVSDNDSSGSAAAAAVTTSDSEQQASLLGGNGSSGGNPLADSLNATATASTAATLFKDRNFLLPKGTIIQCSMRTRIETEVAGMVACTNLRDVYSDNQKVLLIERGSIIEGEYQNTAEMGATRIFILWTRIRTPNGVVVSLNSPATDSLGGAGVSGHVDHHFWRRFGNAVLFSIIQDGMTTGLQRLERAKTAQTIVYENSGKLTDDIVQEILKSTSNIPPTIYKNQGDNAAVYVARDIDFSNVYGLQPRVEMNGNLYNGSIRQ